MKIKSLRISNILSFQHYDDIASAEPIVFEDNLNIIIGENGAGKSTALEVINFLFKKVLFKQYNVNQELFSQKSTITPDERRNILLPQHNPNYNGFRLEPNWDSEDKPQTIRIDIQLDAIDIQNINSLKQYNSRFSNAETSYTTRPKSNLSGYQQEYVLDITLNRVNSNFTVNIERGLHDFGYEYLMDYNYYKELINIYNLEHPKSQIPQLYESFTLISSYRNYHAFNASISLRDHHPTQQIQQLKNQDYAKSLNANESSEPSIFSLVRLRVAEKHFSLISEKYDESECEEKANKLPFVASINKKLKIVNIECKIKLLDLRTWQYSFEFFDIRRKKVLSNINSLSAGQKAIIHLVFESYGRGDLKGGVVIIDEPEIHLHYQFQNEYLQVIRELNEEQNCQYILVTHSEALINSSTINQVKRFSLNKNGYTEIKAPTLNTDQKTLIKILDNTRSTYAFFAKKVVLVEGDTDRYFFKSIIQDKFPELDQEIAILYIGGKGNFIEWSQLFKNFGLLVYNVCDFDYSIECFYPAEKGARLKTAAEITAFKLRNTDWEHKIDKEYIKRVFILKNGNLEHYLNLHKKGLPETINFCNTHLATFLNSSSSESKEIIKIIKKIAN